MGAFDGRVVVVTGGAGALGAAVVQRLVAEGASVRVPVRDVEQARSSPVAAVARVEMVGPVDVADAASVDRFYDAIGGELWASVHSAGGFAMAPIESTDVDMFEAMHRMNALSCFLCCRAAVRQLRARGGGGRIVNVAARPALLPELAANKVAYVASKASVAAITQALGAELAQEGIWVNAVLPEIIDTPANRKAMPAADHARWPSPADIAETIVFLAAPENRSTSAALVPVYGRG